MWRTGGGGLIHTQKGELKKVSEGQNNSGWEEDFSRQSKHKEFVKHREQGRGE